jgi:hypothetical protein
LNLDLLGRNASGENRKNLTDLPKNAAFLENIDFAEPFQLIRNPSFFWPKLAVTCF